MLFPRLVVFFLQDSSDFCDSIYVCLGLSVLPLRAYLPFQTLLQAAGSGIEAFSWEDIFILKAEIMCLTGA